MTRQTETDIQRVQTALARLPGQIITIKADHTAHEDDINARLDALFESAGITAQVRQLKLERMGLHQASSKKMEEIAAEKTRLTSALEVLEELRASDDFAAAQVAKEKDGQVIDLGALNAEHDPKADEAAEAATT